MNFTSTKGLLALGIATGTVASGLSVLTNTGLSGAYVFGLLIMLAVLIFSMWPERTRFFVGRPRSKRNDEVGATPKPP